MNRVFNTSSIESICTELKKLANQCKDHVEQMEQVASKARAAVESVPSGARSGAALSAAGSLKRALKTDETEEFLRKLENCRVRALSLIPAADSQYASETESLSDTVRQISDLLSEIGEFLVSTPLTVDYSSFSASLAEMKERWNKVTEDARSSIDKLLNNIKGAQTVCQAFSKDPVNLSTGNFIYDRTDLEIPGHSPLVFRRFYNAISTRSGAMGRDWNHNYEVGLCVDGEETVLFLEDGKEERFFLKDGKYMSLFASTGSLEQAEEGYKYVTREQKEYLFDRDGRCICQKGLSGEETVLLYEKAGKEEGKGQLTEVRRLTGEWLRLEYNGDGLVSQVTDHAGRTVKYSYEGGFLAGAELPGGAVFHYEYSPSGKLRKVTNPRGIATVENTFDEGGRTVFQKFPDGTSMSYAYDEEKKTVELTERNGSRTAYVHDRKYRDVKHIHANGEERFEYNKNNQKTLYVDRLGNRTQYGYDTAGNLTRVIDALGNKTEIRYGEKNRPVHVSINGKEKIAGEYDQDGRLLSMKDAIGNRVEIAYNAKGWPCAVKQADGSSVRLVYDARGNITEIQDASGIVTRYEYDALNRMTESVDGNGNRTQYAYDETGNVTEIKNAEGNICRYEYNESGKVTKVTDFDGHSILREYNVLNRPSKIIDKEGRETLLSYDSMWNLARVITPDGAKTTYIYNEHNLLSRVKHADGAVVRYTYDANGNRTGEEDENGAKTTFLYDALGRVTEVRGEEGLHYLYQYDGEGNLIRAEDALGNAVEMEYDGNGNLIRETNPLGESRSYTYTALGDVESVTDEAGRKTRYVYLPGGMLEGIFHSDGTDEHFTYDGSGNLKSHTLATGFTLSYVYDSMDRITEIQGSGGERKRYTYDALGNVTSMTDGNGNTTAYEYSLSGQLTKVTDALGNETEYRYDVCDRLVEIRQYGEDGSLEDGNKEWDARGMDADLVQAERQNGRNRRCQVTRYVRDLRGQVTEVIDALGQREEYAYDKKGQLLSKLDKEGYLTRYAYTKQGDISGIQYADGREVKLSYNPLRHLTEVQDWMGQTKITLDALGRARKVTYPDGKEVSYTYGKSGERTSITYPDGRTVHYGYDEQVRLSELREGDSIITYGYDPYGRLQEKQFPNGTKTSYSYDAKDQLTELIHRDPEGILDRYTYLYDLTGNKIGITKERRGLSEESGAYTYSYDALGRLSEIRKDGQMKTRYGYDAYSNRVSKEEGTGHTLYRHNAVNQLVAETRAGMEKTYQYDRRGNLTSITENGQMTRQYVYGALNRLEEAVNQAGKTAKYQYNGLGHRVGRQEGSIPKEQLERLDPQNRIKAETEIGNWNRISYTIDLTREYHNLLERSEGDSIQTYYWDGNVASYEENGQRSYYLQDELGSPLRIEDATGRTRESYGYGAFGEDLYGNQGELQPFGYTGYQKDGVAGTYYAQAREYQSSIGRFGSRDRIEGSLIEPITLNDYTYCCNNSFYFVDLNGLWITAVVGGIVGGVFGGISQVVTDIATGEKPSLKKVVSAVVGGTVGGALAGTGVGAGYAGAASGAASKLVEGIWDMADGTTEFSAKQIKNLGAEILWEGGIGAITGGILDKFTGKFTEKLGGKLIGKFSLGEWKAKYLYADKRIRNGGFTLLKSLKLHGIKGLAVESVEGMPEFAIETLKNTVMGWGKKIEKSINWEEVVDSIATNLKNLWEKIQELEDIESCLA